MNTRLNNRGNSILIIILIILGILVVSAGGFYIFRRNNDVKRDPPEAIKQTSQEEKVEDTQPEPNEMVEVKMVTTTVTALLSPGGSLSVTHPESWVVEQGSFDQGGLKLRDSTIKAPSGLNIHIFERDGIGGACPLDERTDTFTLKHRLTTSIPLVVFSEYSYSDPQQTSYLRLEDHNSPYILQEVKDMKENETLTDSCKLYIYNVVDLANDSALFVSLNKSDDESNTLTYDQVIQDPDFLKAVQSISK